MSIKPFVEDVKGDHIVDKKVKPFVDSTQGGVEVKSGVFDENEIVKQEIFVMRSVRFLGSTQGFIVTFTLFFILVLFIDALQKLQGLYENAVALDAIYLIVLAFLLSSLAIGTYINYRQVVMLKNAAKLQRAFRKQKEKPTKKIIRMTLKLLKKYKLSKDTHLIQQAGILRERISSSQDYKAIYQELDEEVLEIIDIKVQKRIKTASSQAALSTAISPLAPIDAGIVIWRGVLLTKEIAKLYGFKPGWISTVALFKKGALTIFFAGASELAVEYVNVVSESTFISKISLSAGQGISNGVLLARLGYGVMQACRPLPMRVKRQSFVVSIIGSIKDTII